MILRNLTSEATLNIRISSLLVIYVDSVNLRSLEVADEGRNEGLGILDKSGNGVRDVRLCLLHNGNDCLVGRVDVLLEGASDVLYWRSKVQKDVSESL